jgi:2,3,4,5-tetrahydropyridine-2,6-dicarboxylate N-succinyltransferase
MADLEHGITDLWERREGIGPDDKDARKVVRSAIELLDAGDIRVAEVVDDRVVVHEWVKQAVLLYFRVQRIKTIDLPPFEFADKVPLKRGLKKAGVRAVPGAIARFGSFIEPGAVLMPSFVNIGARVGANTMVDTWATVGSCAQVGRNVHLSGGVGIAGVLEPPQAAPVVIEDDCLIGSRCIVAEGARVGRGSVLGAGCILTGSIPVIDAATGEECGRGVVPPWSVAILATRPRSFGANEFGLPCVLVVKRLPEGERHDKAALNDLLRDHGATT